jgi:thiosulfate/3-mercaptopyruvate sulfurtransferase
MKKIVSFLTLICLSLPAWSSPPVVDIEWLGQHLNDKDLLIVDIRPKNYFEYAHIQGSTHTDTALWRQPGPSGIQSMLPDKQHLQGLLSQMGATPESHIVLVGSGDSAYDLANATRVYWTLEQVGHEKKSILDGGIISYANARLPLVRGASNVPPSTYSIFRVKQDQITADEIHKNTNLNLLDTRSKAEYLGIYQGAPDERAGTIPGAVSLPFDWFTVNGGGSLLSKDNLQTLLATVELDKEKATVVFCHTGLRASLGWFVLHEILDNENAILYDASTLEWAKRKDLPMQQKIPVKH